MSASASGARTSARSSVLPAASRTASSSGAGEKWSAIAPWPWDMTMQICEMPARAISSTAYWITGRSTTGRRTFGTALEAGRKRVPRPAAGMTPLRTGIAGPILLPGPPEGPKPGLARLSLFARLEDDAPVLAQSLRLVERHVGGPQQRRLVGAGEREACHPDRDRDRHGAVTAEGLLGHLPPDLLGCPEPSVLVRLG